MAIPIQTATLSGGWRAGSEGKGRGRKANSQGGRVQASNVEFSVHQIASQRRSMEGKKKKRKKACCREAVAVSRIALHSLSMQRSQAAPVKKRKEQERKEIRRCPTSVPRRAQRRSEGRGTRQCGRSGATIAVGEAGGWRSDGERQCWKLRWLRAHLASTSYQSIMHRRERSGHSLVS